jgi:hypothetical protein
VSSVFILGTAIAAVTDDTTDFAMFVFQEIGILQVSLFPFLQRRQLTTSAFAGGFFGYRLLYH